MRESREQGIRAAETFRGDMENGPIKELYGESAPLFASLIKERLVPGHYSLGDLGSHRGDFLQEIVSNLPEYDFETTAFDSSRSSLMENSASYKVQADLASLPSADKTLDVVIARYALAWNKREDQSKILSEIKRVTKNTAIIQHQGAGEEDTEVFRAATGRAFDGRIPALRRDNYYLSTRTEMEQWMGELDIRFDLVQNRKISHLSETFIQKYNLSEAEAADLKDMLGNSDYVQQMTWVLNFGNE